MSAYRFCRSDDIGLLGTFRFPKVHPAEISEEFLETVGFRPAGGHLLHAAQARSD